MVGLVQHQVERCLFCVLFLNFDLEDSKRLKLLGILLNGKPPVCQHFAALLVFEFWFKETQITYWEYF